MAFNTLVVEIAGLCMLVKRKSREAGLYVLMPKVSGAHAHCAYVESSSTTSKVRTRKSIDDQIIDLRALSQSGSMEPTFAWRVVEMGRYQDKSATIYVDEHWLDVGATEASLGARVALPLLCDGFEMLGDPACLKVPNPVNGGTQIAYLHGQAKVTFPVIPHLSGLEIAGITLVPDGDKIELKFMNVPPGDADGSYWGHDEDDEVHHANAYYSLLFPRTEWSAKKKLGKPVKVGKKVTGTKPGDTTPPPCSDAELPRSGGASSTAAPGAVRHIDPYNCTLGGGCLPNEPC